LPWLTVKRGHFDFVLDREVTIHKIALIQLGLRDVYYINDYEMAKEMLSLEEFSHREVNQYNLESKFVTPCKLAGIVMTSGGHWSKQRQFSHKALKTFGLGKKSSENIVNTEIDEMISGLLDQSGDVKIADQFDFYVINILWAAMAGDRMHHDNPEELRLMHLVKRFFTGRNWFLFLPVWLAKLFPVATGLQERKTVMRELNDFLMKVINEHEKTLDQDNLRDFTDAYLAKVKEGQDASYTIDDLCMILQELMMAGTETTSTTLKWVLLFFTIHQA